MNAPSPERVPSPAPLAGNAPGPAVAPAKPAAGGKVALFGAPAVLKNEKRIILGFRFVVMLVVIGFFYSLPPEVHVPWQFYFVTAVFMLSNFVFLFEGVETFDARRAQTYIFAFDIAMLTVIMIFLGLTNKEFYLVFFLTIFVSALSKKASHAFAISTVMAGLYVVFAAQGNTDVGLTSPSFLVRVVLFFVVSSFVGHISETSERRQKEVGELETWKRKAEASAVEQDKMAAVGLLAAGIAHEFNNLLAGIQGYADLAKMGAATPEEFADVVSQQCKQAAGIVRDLLSFSRKRGGELDVVNVGEAVEQVLRLVHKEMAARDIRVEKRIESGLLARAEQGTIERVALNLVVNAIEAMEKGGRLDIQAASAAGEAVIKFTDNGRGMDAETIARAFELFSATRQAKSGTVRAAGLGLPVSRRLVERSGGRIEIASAPGAGTTVTVTLPMAMPSGQVAASEVRERKALAAGATGTGGVGGAVGAGDAGAARARS